jgi:hypothetical protein
VKNYHDFDLLPQRFDRKNAFHTNTKLHAPSQTHLLASSVSRFPMQGLPGRCCGVIPVFFMIAALSGIAGAGNLSFNEWRARRARARASGARPLPVAGSLPSAIWLTILDLDYDDYLDCLEAQQAMPLMHCVCACPCPIE